MRRISHDTYATVFSVAYLGLMTNALLALGCLPVLLLLVLTDVAISWPLVALTAPLAAPALTAAFTVFRSHAEEGSANVARGFLTGWWVTARRALLLGVTATLALVVLAVDLQVLVAHELAVLIVPGLAVLVVLVLVVCMLGLVAIAEVPDAPLREVVKASAVLGVRRWYLSALSLVVLGSLAWFFTVRPVLALGLAAAPLLYLVWANGRYTLRPAIHVEPTAAGLEN